MLKFVIILALIAITQSRPAEEPIAIVKSESDSNPDGSYSFLYEGADGSFREEKAVAMNVGQEDHHLSVTGMYKYIDADGKTIEVHYTADKNGFVPLGTNIPEAIVRAAKASTEIKK